MRDFTFWESIHKRGDRYEPKLEAQREGRNLGWLRREILAKTKGLSEHSAPPGISR